MRKSPNTCRDTPERSRGRSPLRQSRCWIWKRESKITAGFTEEDQHFLRLAGEVLTNQTRQIVEHWRSHIIANIPNLPDIPECPGRSDPRIPGGQQSSLRAMDPGYLPAALRSGLALTISRKLHCAIRARKRTRSTESNRHRMYPARHIAFTAVMNETLKPYLCVEEGAISAAYRGPATDAMPTPKPTTNRDTTRTQVPGAEALPQRARREQHTADHHGLLAAQPVSQAARQQRPDQRAQGDPAGHHLLQGGAEMQVLGNEPERAGDDPRSYPNSRPVRMTTRPTMNSQNRNRPKMSFGVTCPALASAAVVAISFPPE